MIGNNQKNILSKDLLVLKNTRKSIQHILSLPLSLYTRFYLSSTFLLVTRVHHTTLNITKKLTMQKTYQVTRPLLWLLESHCNIVLVWYISD